MCLKIETFCTQQYLISSGFCRSIFRKIRCYREVQNKRNHSSCASTHFTQHCVACGVHVRGPLLPDLSPQQRVSSSNVKFYHFHSWVPYFLITPTFTSHHSILCEFSQWFHANRIHSWLSLLGHVESRVKCLLFRIYFFVFDVGLLSFYALLLIWLKMQTALATKTNETTARFYACYSVPQRYMRMATQKVSFVRQGFVCQ